MTKTVEWHVRVTEEVAKRIDAAAAERGMSRTSYLLSCALCPQTVPKQSHVVDTNSPKWDTNSPQRKEADPRHVPIRELIKEVYQRTFGVQCPWSGAEAGQLGHLLKAMPGVTVEQFEVMVRNWSRSEGVKPESPREFIAHLPSYAAGPLDKFGKTQRPLKPAPVQYLA